MVTTALKSGNGGILFKTLVQILGLPCKFVKSSWGTHVNRFCQMYEDVSSNVSAKSRAKVKDSLDPDPVTYPGSEVPLQRKRRKGSSGSMQRGFSNDRTNQIIPFH